MGRLLADYWENGERGHAVVPALDYGKPIDHLCREHSAKLSFSKVLIRLYSCREIPVHAFYLLILVSYIISIEDLGSSFADVTVIHIFINIKHVFSQILKERGSLSSAPSFCLYKCIFSGNRNRKLLRIFPYFVTM